MGAKWLIQIYVFGLTNVARFFEENGKHLEKKKEKKIEREAQRLSHKKGNQLVA